MFFIWRLKTMAEWSFLTNHACVFVCVAQDPSMRMRDIADAVGITERAAHRIVAELVEEGYVRRRRDGRRNCYEVRAELPFRQPLRKDLRMRDLLAVMLGEARPASASARNGCSAERRSDA